MCVSSAAGLEFTDIQGAHGVHECEPLLAAVQHAALVLDLCSKSKALVGGLFEAPENEVASIRLRAHCTYTGHQHEKYSYHVMN